MTNVPLILSWPGGLPAGRVVKETVQSIDLMPTLLELSHLSLPKTLQGQNLLPLLAEEGDQTREQWQSRPAFSERVTQASRIATAETEVDSFAIVTEGWKLIHNVRKPDDFPEYELFDHHNDPLNLKDLAPENPEVVERLSQQLEQWHEQALAARLPSDDEFKGGLSAQELERLRSLGYIR
jgi:arylsulfatase A-like enzyme